MLVEPDGRAKIVDFGIASNDRAAVKLTTAGVAFGTPEYISPEMAMGLGTDARSDLYSLGCVLYEMVTGRLPFVVKGAKGLLLAHGHEQPPPPSSVAPAARISPALEAVILRAMAKLPEERFDSARAMREALLSSAQRPPRKRRTALVVLVLASAALAAFVWRERLQPSPTEPTITAPAAKQAAPAGKQRRRAVRP